MVHWWCAYCDVEHRVPHDVRISRQHSHAVIDIGHLRCSKPPKPNPLSKAQTEVVRRVSAGMLLTAVARDMNITYNTVTTHLRRARAKTGTTGIPSLVELARAERWVK
jgi:DNA-binding CsgD family transcriptional regulator